MLNLDLARQVFAFLSLSPPFLSIKKLFLLLLLVSGVCVLCGSRQRWNAECTVVAPWRPLSPCLRVRMCLLDASILCPIPGQDALTCLFPTSSTRKSQTKKKGKKFLLFFLFFLYHLWCGCPLPSRGYIAPPCAPCRYQTVFFFPSSSSSFFHPFR